MRTRIVALGAVGSLVLGLGVGLFGKGREVTLSVAVASPAAEVAVLLNGNPVGSTDSSGVLTHSFTAKVGEQLTCTLEASHHESNDTLLAVPEYGDLVLAAIVLVPSQEQIALTVEVQEESGTPIAGALISVDGEPTGSSSAEGQWSDTVVRPHNTSVSISVSGIPDAQRAVVVEGLDTALVFRRPGGLPVTIRAAHGVSGVGAYSNGVKLGQTDDQGRLSTAVPFSNKGAVIGFKLPGARIADWTISPRQMAARRTLKHEIRVEPLERPRVQVTAVFGDDPSKAVRGYDVYVNGSKVGVTKSDGTFEGAVKGLVGERIAVRVVRGTEGVGSARMRIGAGKRDHAVRVVVKVPKIIRLTVVDDKTQPVSGVVVRLGGNVVGTTNAQGQADCSVPQLNAEYKLSLQKTGYLTKAEKGGAVVIRPEVALTEKRIEMEPLYFSATFLDSLSGRPAMGLEVRMGNTLLATTQGIPVRILVPKLGKHTLELRSADAMYPQSQKKTVKVTENGQKVKVDVTPRPVTLDLTFEWDPSKQPARDMQVQLKGERLALPPAMTDPKGHVRFADYGITIGETYTAELTVGAGTLSFPVVPSSYLFARTIPVKLLADIKVCAMEGQESARIRLFDRKMDVVLGNPPMFEGTGCLEAQGLGFGQYFLVAEGEAVVEKEIVIDGPLYEETIDTNDPFVRAEKLREAGSLEQAAELYADVRHDHPRFSDAQKQLGFYRMGNKEFGDAYTAFDNAIGAEGHAVDPYMFLAGAQSAHRIKKWDDCIEWSSDAFTYASMFAAGEKGTKRTHALYVQSLCYHDSYFSDRTKGDCAAERSRLLNAVSKWKQFIAEAEAEGEDPRDSRDLLTMLQAEFLAMDCE